MRSVHPARPRFAIALAAAAFFAASPLGCPDAAAAGGKARIETWTMRDGRQIHATIKSYNLTTKILTLETPDFHTSHVSPRDLTGASKLRWLKSDAFLLALSTYQPPEGSGAFVLRLFGAIVLTALLFVFGTFWLTTAIFTGERQMRHAARVFLRGLLITILFASVAAFFAWFFDRFAGHLRSVQILGSAVVVVTFLLCIIQIAKTLSGYFSISRLSALLVMAAHTVLTGLAVFFFFYMLPILLNREGVDDWLTDSVLVPLGLA